MPNKENTLVADIHAALVKEHNEHVEFSKISEKREHLAKQLKELDEQLVVMNRRIIRMSSPVDETVQNYIAEARKEFLEKLELEGE